MPSFASYLQRLSTINGLGTGHPVQWLFYPGMLFSSRDKWWGDFQFRPLPHEGMDICWYRRSPHDRTLLCFTPEIRVPAMEDGILVNVCDDFLGRTLVVEKPFQTPQDHRVVMVYAHVVPEPELALQDRIKAGQIIARVCDTKKNPLLPPHLHLSCFELFTPAADADLTWTLFTDPDKINMILPQFL